MPDSMVAATLFEQVCVERPASALDVTLLASAAANSSIAVAAVD